MPSGEPPRCHVRPRSDTLLTRPDSGPLVAHGDPKLQRSSAWPRLGRANVAGGNRPHRARSPTRDGQDHARAQRGSLRRPQPPPPEPFDPPPPPQRSMHGPMRGPAQHPAQTLATTSAARPRAPPAAAASLPRRQGHQHGRVLLGSRMMRVCASGFVHTATMPPHHVSRLHEPVGSRARTEQASRACMRGRTPLTETAPASPRPQP